MSGISDQQREQDERSLTRFLVIVNSLLLAALLVISYMNR